MGATATARRLSLPSALLVLLAGLPAPLRAQGEETALTVRVIGEDGAPVFGAHVLVQGVGIGGVTGRDGQVHLARLAPGSRRVEVRHLGYGGAEALVMLESGRHSVLHFDLPLRPIQLAEVRVRARKSLLLRNGFMDRRSNRGSATFITRQEIVQMKPRYLSDVLRRVAGLRLQSSPSGGSTRAAMRGQRIGPCPIQYIIDGAFSTMYNVDEIRPEDVEGLEIYRGSASIPPAFNQGTALCGVVVIWTRIE